MTDIKSYMDKANREAKKAGSIRPAFQLLSELTAKPPIRTGNLPWDLAIGGGLTPGGIVQIVGQPHTGKTRATLDIIAYNQRINPDFVAAYAYTEGADIPVIPMRQAGIDPQRTIIMNVLRTGEDLLDSVRGIIEHGKIDLLVIDSIANIAPASEINTVEKEGYNKEFQQARLAALMSKFFRHFCGTSAQGDTVVLLINQERADLSAAYAGARSKPGGKAMEYTPKLIVRLSKVKSELIKENAGKTNEITIGHTVRGEVEKNNTGRGFPYATFRYVVLYGKGVDRVGSLVQATLDAGIIRRPNQSVYEFTREDGTTTKYTGRDNFVEGVRSSSEIQQELERAFYRHLDSLEFGNTGHHNTGDPILPEQPSEEN